VTNEGYEIFTLPLSLPSREGESPLPLWERDRVRGVSVVARFIELNYMPNKLGNYGADK